MKRFIIVSFAILLALSCNDADLSCDPAINAWAKESISEFENSSVEDIVQLPLSRQQAIYRGISGKKKMELWSAKFQHTFMDDRLNKSEKEQLMSLYSRMSAKIFDSTEEWEVLESYLCEWESAMREQYNWDDTKFFLYCQIWLTESQLKRAVHYDSITKSIGDIVSGMGSGTTESSKCTCLTDIYCSFAEGQYRCEIENNKCELNNGCGWLGGQSCTGTCK